MNPVIAMAPPAGWLPRAHSVLVVLARPGQESADLGGLLYAFRRAGPEIERDGLTLVPMVGTLDGVPAAGAFIDQLASAGINHTCGLRVSGIVTCWGDPADGNTPAPAGTIQSIDAGLGFNMAIQNGNVAFWYGN